MKAEESRPEALKPKTIKCPIKKHNPINENIINMTLKHLAPRSHPFLQLNPLKSVYATREKINHSISD